MNDSATKNPRRSRGLLCVWWCEPQAKLTLRELRSTAGAAETRLLAFLHTSVACQEALLAKLLRQVAVVLHQSTRNALHAGARLTSAAAAVNQDHDIHIAAHSSVLQRSDDRVAILRHF